MCQSAETVIRRGSSHEEVQTQPQGGRADFDHRSPPSKHAELLYDISPEEEDGKCRGERDVEDEIAKELEGLRDPNKKLFKSIRIETQCREFF
jgi:hypothetical protein